MFQDINVKFETDVSLYNDNTDLNNNNNNNIINNKAKNKNKNENTINNMSLINDDNSISNRKKRKYGCVDNSSIQPTTLVKTSVNIDSNFLSNRLSQACDRCRLKKIKCDGLKPNCSQCLKVNFICKTSDKLTRRGFPRGYTEMLEKEVVLLQKKLKLFEENHSNMKIDIQTTTDGSNIISTNCSSSGNENDIENSETDIITKNKTSNTTNLWTVINQNIKSNNKIMLNSTVVINNNNKNNNYLSNNFQLTLLSTNLQLNSQFNYLPNFLINKYNMDVARINNLIIKSINNFLNLQNSLIPILYPSTSWEQSLKKCLKSSNSLQTSSIDILVICFIIQLNWSCFDNFKLFQLTKFICLNSSIDNDTNSTNENNKSLKNQKLKILQLLNLSIYYFMTISTDDSSINLKQLFQLTTEFIYKNLNLPTFKIQNKIIHLSCFRFLKNLWSIINNIDEKYLWSENFGNKNSYSKFLKDVDLEIEFEEDCFLNSKNNKDLSQFIILSKFVKTIKKDSNSNNIENLNYQLENFKDILLKGNMFFNNNENYLNNSLTKKDSINLQLSLYSLILSFFKKFDNKHLPSLDNIFINDTNYVESGFQILLTYYNLLVDNNLTIKEQPQQFQLLYFLPFKNDDIINSCLLYLNLWSISNLKNFDNDLQLPINWNFMKYQTFLIRFCSLWFFDDLKNPLLLDLQKNFRFDIKLKKIPYTLDSLQFNRLGYLQSISNFNDTNKLINNSNMSFVIGRSNLLKSNSNAIMDQFNMFAEMTNSPSNNFLNATTAAVISNNITGANNNVLPTVFDSLSLKSLLQTSSNNNLIDMSNYQSQILLNQGESDDGYAEDDDEDDVQEEQKFEDNKPLEIPFNTKRHDSLFQTRFFKPPSHRMNSGNYSSNNEETTVTKKGKNKIDVNENSNKVDHIILTESISRRSSSSYLNGSSIKTESQSQTLSYYSLNKSNDSSIFDKLNNNSGNDKKVSLSTDTEASNDNNQPIMGMKNNNNANTNTNMNELLVETPRSFTDMLLLQQPSQLNLWKTKSNNGSSQQITNKPTNKNNTITSANSSNNNNNNNNANSYTGTLVTIPSLLSVDKLYDQS
ncbi:hypothetical protein Kpol_1016p20 [Vanderwaltozyma polyspora DSM 70294]|uniref:Zn(2)-C6 fungal-type domain-containing protein n=1 Tax=Vanderwaltozyma polyspora (strain ATCC 22028 / DSM 70294 / BCRC 21397 / CBS 2163 / NBRC 10782 / NRRL Y-8283 / UCD 57-17) TaxID=436907 RepID=A7TNT5_VANPO|nr:uncharacterized protein Kpol_1016p20 [Vanderwaltozyma polyspora DSM 70294]EDO16078.1 hypothetical protein Kpol_1016p20 [Vanderwaltozyma polyspora DSM 70294]